MLVHGYFTSRRVIRFTGFVVDYRLGANGERVDVCNSNAIAIDLRLRR